jgi:hypothetical protein
VRGQWSGEVERWRGGRGGEDVASRAEVEVATDQHMTHGARFAASTWRTYLSTWRMSLVVELGRSKSGLGVCVSGEEWKMEMKWKEVAKTQAL